MCGLGLGLWMWDCYVTVQTLVVIHGGHQRAGAHKVIDMQKICDNTSDSKHYLTVMLRTQQLNVKVHANVYIRGAFNYSTCKLVSEDASLIFL